MRHRSLAWAGVVLGSFLISPLGRADEASAEAAIKKVRGYSKKTGPKNHKVVTHVILEGLGRRRKLGTTELRALKEFKGLQYLNLNFSDLSDAGLYELRDLKSLRTLSVHNTQITDAGLPYLRGLDGLTELMLSQTRVTDAGLRELKTLKSLHALNLSKTRVTDAGMKELKGFTNLRALTLDDTQVTDTGVYELIGLPNLESLLLNRTRVTDASLKLLPYSKSLRQVQVWETRGVTDAGVKNLKAALPQLTVGRELTR